MTLLDELDFELDAIIHCSCGELYNEEPPEKTHLKCVFCIKERAKKLLEKVRSVNNLNKCI